MFKAHNNMKVAKSPSMSNFNLRNNKTSKTGLNYSSSIISQSTRRPQHSVSQQKLAHQNLFKNNKLVKNQLKESAEEPLDPLEENEFEPDSKHFQCEVEEFSVNLTDSNDNVKIPAHLQQEKPNSVLFSSADKKQNPDLQVASKSNRENQAKKKDRQKIIDYLLREAKQGQQYKPTNSKKQKPKAHYKERSTSANRNYFGNKPKVNPVVPLTSILG